MTPSPNLWKKVWLVSRLQFFELLQPCLTAVLPCEQWWRCTILRPLDLMICPCWKGISSIWYVAMVMDGVKAFLVETEASSLKITCSRVARPRPRPPPPCCCIDHRKFSSAVQPPAQLPTELKHRWREIRRLWGCLSDFVWTWLLK